MKKTAVQPKKLTLDRTTIVLLSGSQNKGFYGMNGIGSQSTTVPACNVTNTGNSGIAGLVF